VNARATLDEHSAPGKLSIAIAESPPHIDSAELD
jgi:hypothetical protein